MCMIRPCVLQIIIMRIDLKYLLHISEYVITLRMP